MADSPRIQELRRRVQQDPASPAFAPLAEELRRAGRLQEAIDTCRAGLGFQPAYVSARATLGRALLDHGALDEAHEELTAVLAAAPEHLSALKGLGDVHQRRGRLPDALAAYRRALAVAREDPELTRLVASLETTLAGDGESPGAGAPSSAASRPEHPALAPLEQFLARILAARERGR